MYQRVTLSNGLRIVCETIPYGRSVSLGVWTRTGSRNEEPQFNGISHFIEHMMFKGTSRRSTRQIAEAIDAVGGQLNAFTTKEYTCYYAKVLDQHFQLGVDLLADMITNSLFLPAEIEKEKSVVLEEIKSYEDAPDELIYDIFYSLVLKGHELGRSILGTPETVSQFNREILMEYLQKHYTPDNMVFAVAGNIQIDQVIAEVEGRFSGLCGKSEQSSSELPELQMTTYFKDKDTEQVHLCIGGRGVSRKDPRKYTAILLDSILGGSVSSRLFQRLREDEGLVYTTGTNHSSFMDTGVFTIYAGTSMANFERVVTLIQEEIIKLQTQGIDEEELNRAKEQLKGNLLLSLESTCNRMSRLAKMELFQDPLLSPEETVARIEAVTADQVQKMAVELLADDRLITTAIGPFGQEEAIHG
ncbi:MAG TPA: pitrilysin family protein [Bacillota bacterium]|nr:pitrilysin family protein [Bacillota bacterium]HPT87928.1 pitrilysin family protein [Bacillota bacterium]